MARPTIRPRLEALEDRWVPSTLTVTNNLDSGAHSLRADIAAAHNGDTINFAPSLDGQTITLTKGELLLNKNLTIAGPGASELTVNGNNHSRVFEVATGVQVNLSGLTISNGHVVGADGGGIYNSGTLTVSSCNLSGNAADEEFKGATSLGGHGGGIYNSGTLTVNAGSTLSNNSGYLNSGSAIYNSAALTVSDSILSGNSGFDGVIYNWTSGTLTVNNNSAVSGNDVLGIANFGNATVSGSTVSDNSDGGIWNGSAATLKVSDSFLSHNTAADGAGIDNHGLATVSTSTLSDNSASEYGGGIYSNGPAGTLTVTGCILTGNTAQSGGGIYNYFGALTMDGSTLSGNVASAYGGGIYTSGGVINGTFYGAVTVSSCTLSGNTARFGGGIYIGGGTVTVENSSTISGNLAPVGYSADDVDNLAVLYLDSTSTIGVLDGNPARRI